MPSAPVAVLSILVNANTGGASASLTKLDRRLRGTAATANTTTATIAKGAARIGAVMAGAGAASLVAAAQHEQSFAEVRKTVNATEAEFKKIETGLRNMAKRIPVSVNELNALAGEAGALGVKSKDIVRFTRVAADLGVTTDLSSEQAANALARLANIMDTKGQKAFERMGSTLVDLGNKGASTEAEISEMALRIAGAGQTIGLGEDQVLGFASALANVGIRAEAGGTAISKVMLEMQDAVARGGEDLAAFAKIAGMEPGGFAKAFKDDAPAAIQEFVQGLDSIKDSGGSVVETLDTVNLNEIRVRDTLLRLGGATGEVTKAQEIANKAWGDNSALAEEANKRYGTTISQFVKLKNRVYDLGITFGQDLLPQLNKAMKELGKGNLSGAISAMAELGGRMGLKLAGALGKAFLEADILGKLFIGATLLRVFGGKGAITAAGMTLGKTYGRGMVAGMALALPLLLPEAFKLGKKIGDEIRDGFTDAAKSLGGRTVNVLDQALEGITDLRKGAEAIAKIKMPWDDKKAALAEQFGVSTTKAAKSLDKATHSLSGTTEASKKTGKATDQLARTSDKNFKSASGDLKDYAKTSDSETGRARKDFDRLGDGSRDLNRRMSGNFGSVERVTLKALKVIGKNTFEALKTLKSGKNLSFNWTEAVTGKGGPNLFARGGITPVPGTGNGDTVHAMLEPGEVIVNKKAVAAMGGAHKVNRINQVIPRFAKGGVVQQAFGPYDMPPIAYDANHAGGNSHLHLDFFNQAQTIAIGKKMQGMGWSIGEYSGPYGGFGGLSVSHQSPGHYDGTAFDANTASDETRSEVAAVARLLGGAKVGGAMAEKIARVLLTGPDGPLKDIGQGSLDKVRDAANAYLAKNARPAGGVSDFGAGKGSFLSTSYGPPWGGINGMGVTATGVDLTGSPAIHGVAVDPSVIPLGSKVRIQPNPFNYSGAFKAFDTGGAIKGKRIDFYDWRGRAEQLGWGERMVDVEGFLRGGIAGFAKGGVVGTIKALYGKLAKTDSSQRRKEIERKIAKKERELKKAQKKRRRKKLRVTDRQSAMAAMSTAIGNRQSAVNVINDQIQGLTTQHGLTEPRDVSEILEGLGIDPDAELGALPKSQQAALRAAVDADYGVEERERGEEIMGQKGRLDALLSLREQLIVGIDRAQARVEQTKAAITAAQEQEKLAKREARKIERKIASLKRKRDQARGKKGQRGRVALLGDRIAKQRFKLQQVKGVAGHANKMRETLRDNQGDFQDLHGEWSTDLESVQGIGVPLTPNLRPLPLTGGVPNMRGEVLDAWQRLHELGATGTVKPTLDFSPPEVPGVDDSELLQLKLDQAMDTIRRLNFGIAQNPVFMGAFEKGGVALVGESGPELRHLPSGTRIHSAEDTRQLLTPEVTVNINGSITPDGSGRDPVEVMLGDRRLDAKIDRKLNRLARDRSFGGAGGFVGAGR